MWSTLFLASCLFFLSSVSHLDISGDKTLLRSSVPNSLQLLKQEFQSQLQANYANSDGLYLRFLRANEFNIAKTRQNLQEFSNWRENHISSRGRRDSWGLENVPVDTLQDKEGEPVLYYAMAKYNLREFAAENKLDDFSLTIMRGVDTTCENIYSLQQAGKNVSHYSVLVDWNRFSANDQLCPQCIPAYLDLIKSYEANYPLTVKNVVHIKTPKLFMPVLTLMKAFMSEELRNSFHVFTAEENESAKKFLDSWLGKANTLIN